MQDALTSAHEIEPSNPDITAALKQLKKNMEDYKTRRRSSAELKLRSRFGVAAVTIRGGLSKIAAQGRMMADVPGFMIVCTGYCCRSGHSMNALSRQLRRRGKGDAFRQRAGGSHTKCWEPGAGESTAVLGLLGCIALSLLSIGCC